jgi:hypothetical protein
MFGYIKDLGLEPKRPYTERDKTDLIALHHFESDASAQAVHAYHISRGHNGIDYNIVVLKNGDVVWGRGLEYEGGHTNNSVPKTRGVNARSVGIACQGNFNLEEMGAAQKDMLKRVVADVVRHYNFSSIKQIVTHKEISGVDYTDCPGTYFPADEIREFIRSGAPAAQTKDPLLWMVTVGDLNFRATPGGKVLKTLHYGDLVYLRRYVKSENWSRVRLGGPDGQEGYVWLKYIGEK